MSLKGLYTALLVSFDEKGQINEKGTREIIRYNIDVMKVDGLYVGGSTGENFLLSFEEKKRIFEIAHDEAQGELKLIAQVGALNFQEAKKLAVLAEGLGYDALSSVTPFYYKFSFEEIKNYYFELSELTSLAMIIYSIPFLTGVEMGLEEFAELFENEKIVGVKYTTADFYLLQQLRERFPDHLIFSGFDEMLLPALSLGVDGAIGSTFNIQAPLARKVFESVEKADLDSARYYQEQMNQVISSLLQAGLYPCLKEILKLAGVDAGELRFPMQSANEKQKQSAKAIHANLKF